MPAVSIIGSGNMATAIGTRAVKHGHTVELLSRNTAKAQALADQIGDGASVAAFLDSLKMRTLDAGGLQAASILESAGLLLMGLARNGAGFDLALGAEIH
jgi:predicted dinucleotide-binding enzyme